MNRKKLRYTLAQDQKNALYRYYRANKRMPSYSEVAQLFGFKSKDSAYKAIQKLRAEGHIETDSTGKILPLSSSFKSSTSDTYKDSKPSLESHTSSRIKLLGLVEAGFPTPADENILDTFSLDDWIIDNKNASFMLRVKGDSMKNAGIHDGDMVIVERTDSPKIGSIVIALIDNAWTMKYLKKDTHGALYLMPANDDFPPLYPENDLVIQAVVKAVIRKY